VKACTPLLVVFLALSHVAAPGDLLGQDPLAAADSAWAAGDHSRALELYTRIHGEGSAPLLALERMALVHAWNERYSQSLALLDEALTAEPGRGDLQLVRARILSWDGQLEASVDGYRRALAADPDSPEVLAGLAQVLSWTGRYGEARAMYDRVLAMDPEHGLARMGLAQVATWSGDLREGEARWRSALDAGPGDRDLVMGLASNLRMQGRERAAGRTLERLDAEQADDPAVREERDRLEAARAPRLSPTYGYTSDSDHNRIHSVRMRARWKLSDPLELNMATGWTDLTQTTRPELDQRVLSADFTLTARALSGWGVRGGLGVWRPGASGQDPAATGLLGASMPPWWPARADLTLSRSVFDVTALVADVQVDLTELRLDGSVRTGVRSSVSGVLSTARFQGTERNTRHLAAARYSHRLRPWLATGPAVRAFTFDRTVEDGYWNPESYGILELPVTLGPTEGRVLPRLEVAPGYQRSAGEADPWSPAYRVEGGLTYNGERGRQAGLSAVYADSGAQRLSGSEGEGYRFRGITLFLTWPFQGR